MGVYDLFSKRKAAEAGSLPQVQHTTLPEKFRVQVYHLLLNHIGKWTEPDRWTPPSMNSLPANDAWTRIFDAVRQEHGRFLLCDAPNHPVAQCMGYLMSADTDHTLDLVEYSLRVLDQEIRHQDLYFYQMRCLVLPDPDAAIREFNTRCRENGVGYVYEAGRIIPSASAYVHTQVVDPALVLLNDAGFRGAQEEFLKAHAHLRRGDTKNAIVEAGKAFESAMKTVCARRGWEHDPGATAKPLVATLLKHGFFPPYLESQLTHLRCLLETGAPVVRNKEGAHGQGAEPVDVPRELAEYAIHLTAANIVLIAKLFGR